MTLNLIVSPLPTSPSGQHYEARLDGMVVCRSRTPFLSAARALLEAGHAPGTILTMRHEGSDTVSLRATLGAAAKLTVVENSREGPRFACYRPPPSTMPIAAVRGRAGTALDRSPASPVRETAVPA